MSSRLDKTDSRKVKSQLRALKEAPQVKLLKLPRPDKAGSREEAADRLTWLEWVSVPPVLTMNVSSSFP